MNQIVSFSGGKDSTAMLLMMLDRGEPIHSVVFFDTGWEFPMMLDHVDRVEAEIDIPIIRLNPAQSFDYRLFERPIIARKGPRKGEVHRIGNGWPSMTRRWCTRIKVDALDAYAKTIDGAAQCIGYAAEEHGRRNRTKKNRKYPARYPLIEYGITEVAALQYCYDRGFDWGGLYKHFWRVSCFCCPLQRLGELRRLRQHYPELWARMLKMDARIPSHNRGFKEYQTVIDLEKRFAYEGKQINMEL